MAGKQSVSTPRKALATEFTELLDVVAPGWANNLHPAVRVKFDRIYQELSKIDDRALDREGRRGS